MKTKATVVTGDVSVWAVPRSAWQIERHPDEPPFEYALYAGDSEPWTTGSVKVYTEQRTIQVPDGIDLVSKAVETLQEAKEEARRECQEKLDKYDTQIRSLLLLTGPSDPDALEGELV
jgi:hypothetical protein